MGFGLRPGFALLPPPTSNFALELELNLRRVLEEFDLVFAGRGREEVELYFELREVLEEMVDVVIGWIM